MKKEYIGLDTKMIHAGLDSDPATGAVAIPIYQTSTFVQSSPGINKGYDYSRSQNPTRAALESVIAEIENGKYGLAFSSGVAAIDAVIKLLQQGDEVIAANDMYGGTYRLFNKIFSKFGIKFHYVNMQNSDAVTSSINQNTKLIWIETPTNPLLNVVDIEVISLIAKQHKILLCVDNTFASPYLQNPLDLGADIALHSATKYLSGHSDVIQGCLIVNDDILHEQLQFIQKSCGAVPGPQDCFLVMRGIKTLHIRMQRHCENAEKIAYFLRSHKKVQHVYWCGFKDHPNYTIAKKQMRGFGGMVSFSLKDESLDKTEKVLSSTKIFALAESLGGVESLINHPVSMSHSSLTNEEKIKAGIVNSLLRLSIGIEDMRDLIEDLKQAIG